VLDPEGPKLAATKRHHLVWEAAAPRWDAKFYRDAVQAAAAQIIDVQPPAKMGVLTFRIALTQPLPNNMTPLWHSV
jgi:hypothetical protein